MIFRADKGFEESPGAARGQPQRPRVICRKRPGANRARR